MNTIEPYKGIAEIYEEIRPSYPESLVQDVISATHLKLDNRLLEIGAGTGKATIQFANKGYRIHTVEIGEDMAAILRDKCSIYPNVTIDVASFEEWKSTEDKKYDMIYSAQAFHWINKDVKYHKCYDLLKDKGYLVLFWYHPSGQKNPVTKEINSQVNRIIKKYKIENKNENNLRNEKPKRMEHTGVSKNDDRKTEIEESGLFKIVNVREYFDKTRNSPNQYLKAIKSVPAYASILDELDANIIKRIDNELIDIINQHGGYVDDEFRYSLYIAKKI